MRKRNPARWRAMESRLGREPTVWVSTVRHNGRPHSVPVWFVWLDIKLYFATGAETQKFANLFHNQNITITLPDPNKVLIIEGEAHVSDRSTVEIVADYFYHKYEWDFRYDDSALWRLIEVTPHKILSWGDGYDQKEGIRLL